MTLVTVVPVVPLVPLVTPGKSVGFRKTRETRAPIKEKAANPRHLFLIEPEVSIAKVINLDSSEVSAIMATIIRRKEEIDAEWTKHFEQ